MEKVEGRFYKNLGEVHKFLLQKASTAKRLEQWAEAVMSTSNVVKSLGGRSSAPDPAGELASYCIFTCFCTELRLSTCIKELWWWWSLPRPSSWWEGGWMPPLQEPSSPLLAGLEPLRRSLFTPLSSNSEYAPAKPLELSVFKLFIFTVAIVGNLA